MRDGTELLGDRYYARQAGAIAIVLIRSCYGRSAFKVIATVFAERGMQVLFQAAGEPADRKVFFRPFFDEQDDGADTWNGSSGNRGSPSKLALWGISYLGNTAWAIARSRVSAKVNALGLHRHPH